METLEQKKKNLIKLIHIAKSKLAMDDETYRQMLEAETQKNSTTQMSSTQLDKVLKRLKASGFKPKSQPVVDLQTHKIKSLWQALHQAGKVRDRSDKALETFILRQTGIAKLAWLNNTQASQVIEALKQWQTRK